MRRQISARLQAFRNPKYRHRNGGRTENNHSNHVLRFSSTDGSVQTRPLHVVDRHQNRCQSHRKPYNRRHHRDHQRQQEGQPHFRYASRCTGKETNCNSFRRGQHSLPSFQGLRACYFSNAATESARNEKDSSIDNNSDSMNTTRNQISKQLAHLFVEEEDPNKFNYVKVLKSWYLDHHGEIGSVVQDAFGTEMIQNPNSGRALSAVQGAEEDDNTNRDGLVSGPVEDTIRQIFTATFTCPVTNERFEAGRLKGYYDIDDKNFYSRKKVALQAVSAVVLSHKMKASSGKDEMFDSGGGDDDNGVVGSDASTTDLDANYYLKQNDDQSTFRQILQRLYMKHYKISPTQSQSRVRKQDFVGKTHGGTWWTADFTCPITGRIYEAVDLANVSDSMKMQEAGQIWYRKKSDSIHASASNAIESINWNTKLDELEDGILESTDNSNNEDSKELIFPLLSWYARKGHKDLKISIQDNFVVTGGLDSPDINNRGHKLWTASFLCPLTGERLDAGTVNATDAISSTEIDQLVWYTERDAAIQAASQRAYDVFKYRDTRVKDPRFCKEDPGEHTAAVTSNLSMSVQGGQHTFDTDLETNDKELTQQSDFAPEHDEDDFVIEVIPQQIIQSSGSHNGSSKTLDIIAKAWIDSTGVSSDKENSTYSIDNFQSAFSEREKAIRRSLEWISKQDKMNDNLSRDRTQFDVKGEMCNLKIANAILSSLAECHQRVPFDPEPTGVEKCAAAILESMWSSHSTEPDAQSYAFYLKCLEGETPSAVTAKAEKIVDAMESGHPYNERSLPKPNDAIYGSLAEIKAFSGQSSLLECNELHRKTHLCKLSAMAHDVSTFDIDVATKLIDEMRSLSETNDEPSLEPDIEVYNAPLRWSGGHLWSRSYSRVIPWDSYSEIYKDGFKSDSETGVHKKYAEKVEKWVEIIKSKALSDNVLAPNIETYESLIQAWVRCGNEECLLRAETIAKNIITGEYSGIQPRSQTFYPILAAWTYCGSKEASQNIESWIDLLQELVPELEPRLGFPNVLVMAQISLQRQILKHLRNPSNVNTSSMEDCVFDSAMKCSKFFESTIDQYKDSLDGQLENGIFTLVINAWQNAASAAILQDNLEEAKTCFREMQKIVDHFDDLLVWLYKIDGDSRSRTEFLRLLNLAPSVYGAQLAAMSTMEKNVTSRDYDRTMHLILIEEKIRRLEEFNQFCGNDSSFGNETMKGKSDLDALSIFPSEGFMGDFSCQCWSDYIDSSLDILEKGASDSSIGEPDFVRLSMLIARVTYSAKPAVLNSLAKDRIIERIVAILENYCGNDQEKETVISTVMQSLNMHSKRQGSKKIRGLSTESTSDVSYEFQQEKHQESGIADTNGKRRVKKERGYRNDLNTRTSYSRSKVLHSSQQRQAHAK